MKRAENKESLINLLKPYGLLIFWLLVFTILSNGLNLVIPKIVSTAIDASTKGILDLNQILIEFFVVSALIFIFTYL